MTLRRSSVHLLCRAGAAALVVGGAALVGAPAAGAAEEERPVVSLDPPDAEMFLVPTENYAAWFGDAGAAATGADDASVALAQAASLAPPEIAESLGAESVTVASHTGDGEVDVEYGGTVVVQLPAPVDASARVVRLRVLAEDDPEDAHVYSTSPEAGEDPLVVDDLGGNAFEVELPLDDGVYGDYAYLTFDGLAAVDPAIGEVGALDYYLGFTGDGTGAVNLEPGVGVFAAASCSVMAPDPCPPVEVQAGESFDLVVPPSSLLRTLDFGRLDTAEVGLISDSSSSDDYYYSGDDAGLVTRHGADSASVNLPADMGAGPYMGVVMEGDPFSGGYAMTMFQVDVAAPEAPVNPGLRSDTGWVEDVREASAWSTKVVAGVAMLVVAGLITVVAVAPRRRPPAEG